MRKCKFYNLSALFVMLITAMPFYAMAQDPGGGPDAPIDGGVSLLIAAGTAYGVKTYRDNKKQQEEDKGENLQ